MEQKFDVKKEQVEVAKGKTTIKNSDFANAVKKEGNELTQYLSETFSTIKLEEIVVSDDGTVTVDNTEFTEAMTDAANNNKSISLGNLICNVLC